MCLCADLAVEKQDQVQTDSEIIGKRVHGNNLIFKQYLQQKNYYISYTELRFSSYTYLLVRVYDVSSPQLK